MYLLTHAPLPFQLKFQTKLPNAHVVCGISPCYLEKIGPLTKAPTTMVEETRKFVLKI